MRTLQTVVLVFLALQLSPCTCEVNTTWMKDALTQHFSKPRHHVTNPQYKQQAMVFIRDQFKDMGLEVHLQNFSTAVSSVTGINVIGILKGVYFNTSKDRVVGIGAHYDTMRNTPGVDDNGAAVVVMLQAARELSRSPNRPYTILFIAFDFEEWENSTETQVACGTISCGSRHLVNELLPSYVSGPSAWQGIFNDQQNSQTLPDGFDMLESFTVIPMATNFYRSDHVSFWNADYTALFLSDSADYRSYMTQCYHKACDTIQKVTPSMINFAAKTCRALISTINKLDGPTSAANRCQASAGWMMGLAAMMTFWRTIRF